MRIRLTSPQIVHGVRLVSSAMGVASNFSNRCCSRSPSSALGSTLNRLARSRNPMPWTLPATARWEQSCRSYPDRVKTRTLLLLAVACGLAILVAGSIKVFLIADEKSPPQLGIGESATIGDMKVTVDSVERRNGQTLVSVDLVGVDDPDGATSWVLGVLGSQLKPLEPPSQAGAPCGATTKSTPTDCVLAFATDEAKG